MLTMRPAALAFEAVAPNFDDRFAAWQSVAAQRRAVRRVLLDVFPPDGRIFELGGGTGEDAAWLAERNFKLLLTDASPGMVKCAETKLSPLGSRAEIASAEELESFAECHATFDGAFSNFAPLNCVRDLSPAAHWQFWVTMFCITSSAPRWMRHDRHVDRVLPRIRATSRGGRPRASWCRAEGPALSQTWTSRATMDRSGGHVRCFRFPCGE